MVRVVPRQAGGLSRIRPCVRRVVRVRCPMVTRVVEAIPQLDLDDDVALTSECQKPLEPRPVLRVPLRQVECLVGRLRKRIHLEAAIPAIAHRVADVVGPGRLHLVEVRLQVRDLKEVIVLAAAEQEHRHAAVLPVRRVAGPGRNPSGRWRQPAAPDPRRARGAPSGRLPARLRFRRGRPDGCAPSGECMLPPALEATRPADSPGADPRKARRGPPPPTFPGGQPTTVRPGLFAGPRDDVVLF